MSVLTAILPIVLFGMFTFSAILKFSRSKSMVQHWNEYRYPLWFMDIIASLELLGAIGMLAAFWVPVLMKYVAVLFVVLMLGAIHAHLFRARHKPIMALNAFFMLVFAAVLLLV
ncbi:hypothetical protein BRE01_44940 [Brevibacillus reuszeri]|uniref:DoxX family protein n=1 Tax=Brevibacillus reuszeri TaxID=54915 RepID=A0A0K9YL33_9BACL|nr:DoxX family protein [Brevibacillus reuszeri]KNB69372.1 doxX family protein [Brevibacillus reuszeri]MED1860320.1 DoxX family protein [Brevibacillus reuszeri]GED70792.1 hypothetical protein BRE01_44940 [Brevibacillus reuszeri]